MSVRKLSGPPPGLRRLVFVVRALCLLGAATLLAGPAWFRLSPDWVHRASLQIAGGHETTADERAVLLGAALTLLPVALGL